ncbi:MAG: regulator of volume decrease after cellular swelling-domain-containing protein [Linnemannia elongata]|nr:MAG: regulator of volume decrease after cellular swelling-domain-containing protein [Linnemannia elongata]
MAITILQQAPSPSEARIRHTQQNVTVHITPASKAFQNPGTLYIADESLYFFSEASNSGFAIPYPSIIIHAIARESHVGPSIYCQLEGSLGSFGSAHTSTSTSNGTTEEEEEEEDAVLELSFVPAEVSSLDTIYENLSYCASLHQDEMDDEDMDGEGDYYEDDINDHEGLYADADIQGGYTPKSSSATAIGTSSSSGAQGEGEVEQVPVIDLQSGEWYTGNAETDAKFELSEQGQAALAKMESMLQDPHGLIPKPEDEEPGEDAEEDRFKDAGI